MKKDAGKVKNIFVYKRLALRAAALFLPFATALCLRAEDQGIPPGEANVQILAAYAAKDLECGQQHILTVPVLARADQRSVSACVANILAVDCAVWGSENNLPEACLAILLQL